MSNAEAALLRITIMRGTCDPLPVHIGESSNKKKLFYTYGSRSRANILFLPAIENVRLWIFSRDLYFKKEEN